MPVNGSSNFIDTLEGSVVTYTCNTGFELVGNSTQTCELTPNGTFWSFTRPECRRMVIVVLLYKRYAYIIFVVILCGNPGTPANGSTTVTSDTVGSTADHFCNEGFNLDGVNQRVCLPNGSWSDSLPTCIGKL